jgi:exopolysaccharide biosynthesis polyprenyl glycosylphosphotransferase
LSVRRSSQEHRLAVVEGGVSAPRTELGTAPGATAPWEATIAIRHGRRDYWLRRMLATVDTLAIAAAVGLSFGVSAQHELRDLLSLLPVLPLWVALFGLYGLYGRDLKRIGQGPLDDLPPVFHAVLIGSLGLWAYFRFLTPQKLVFKEVVVFGAAGIALVLAFRWLARRLANSVFGPERTLLVGNSSVTPALVRKIRMHPEYALKPVGMVCSDGTQSSGAPVLAEPLPVIGELAETSILELIQLYDVERLIVSQEEVDDELTLDLFRRCGRLHVKVSVLPRGVDAMGPSMEIDDIEGVTVLGLNPLVLSRSSRILKRSLDVAGASIGLLVLSPLMALAALAVKLTSRGPVFFRQTRIGRHGEAFTMYKFRTMLRDAELRFGDLMKESKDPHWLHLDHDPRITRIGRFLRLMSLDELPQLWSVLTGRMSLVGPRPLTLADHEQIEGWERIRLDLAPGITGLWQVLGRTSIPFAEMIKLDYVYVTNWSLWLDIKLLVKTIPAVLLRRGAN